MDPAPAQLPLHALNTRFEWHDHSGPYRRASPEQVRAYDEQGFFLLEHAFDADELARVIAESDPWEARVAAFLSRQEGGRLFIARSNEITFTTHLVTRSELLRRICSGPVFRDLCYDLIGPDVRLYWDQAVYKKPGATDPFPWHQDNGYNFIEPQQYLTCWVALTDATLENGCPWVIPGQHRRGTLVHRPSDLGFVCVDEAPDAVAVPAPAGSMVVFSSLTPHATGPNTTDRVRKAYIVQFAPDGAAVLKRGESGALERAPADEPERQFRVLRGGQEPRA